MAKLNCILCKEILSCFSNKIYFLILQELVETFVIEEYLLCLLDFKSSLSLAEEKVFGHPLQVEAEEALAALVLDKLGVMQTRSTTRDEMLPPPVKSLEREVQGGMQNKGFVNDEIVKVKRGLSPPIRHPSFGLPPPPQVAESDNLVSAVKTSISPPSPPSSVCSTTFLKRGVRAKDLFQASLAADNDRWLQFQIEPTVPAKEQAKQLEVWLAKNLPSKVARSQGIGWIAVKLKDKGKKVAEAKVAWEALTGQRDMRTVNQLAEQYSVLGGKWMCHLGSGKIDRVWSKVATTLLAGGLGTPVYMVKVSPLEDVTPQQAGAGGEHVMIVYNTDYRDTDQVGLYGYTTLV